MKQFFITLAFLAGIITAQAQTISQAEWFMGADPGVGLGNPLTIGSPNDSVNLNFNTSTNNLAPGLYRIFIRCRANNGVWGLPQAGPFIVKTPITVVSRLITQVEYWVDSNPPTLIDVTDSSQISFSQLESTSSLAPGLHHLYFRFRDDLARWSGSERHSFIITTPPETSWQHLVTAAEFFVNVDPGEGNGIAIPLPVDGVWDESEESVQTIITGVPIGLHLVGIRTRDEVGRWSVPVTDTLLVGPILTIHKEGNNVILDWLSGISAEQFHIYRSSTPTDSFAEIDSTTAQTYTDYGIVGTNSESFYQVTFSPRTRSNFRLPNGNSAKK
jgi:hypothetical protein